MKTKIKHSREKLTAMIWSRIPPCWRSLFVNISSGNSLMAERKTYIFLKMYTAWMKNREASAETYDQT